MTQLYDRSVDKNLALTNDPILPFASPIRQLWAKTNQANNQACDIHPLICHLIDVAQVVYALWDHALPGATRSYFADTLHVDESGARQWLAFLAGLHDLGKASPVFQRLHLSSYRKLQAVGFNLSDSQNTYHGLISAWALKKLFAERIGLNDDIAHNLAVAIGGHHGAWPTAEEINKGLGPGQRGEGIWNQARISLFEALMRALDLPVLPRLVLPRDEEAANVFLIALAGLISLADWLGSMSEFFHFAPTQVDLTAYAIQAYRQAIQALNQLGWTGWSPPHKAIPFTQLFPVAPRPLQVAIMSLSEENLPTPPALVIIEAPTGEGKTEAAWYLADRWLWANQQCGVYVAMPTQATSNQMFGRVKAFIEQRYPGQRTNLILMHGDANWSNDMHQLQLAAVNEQGHDTVIAHAWFLPKKRGLLAPFAVGTVDQALLAVLQTPHFFVRLFGLSRKTVIFDEIHAYDSYMNVLFQRLLRWLAAMGTSVILLSATLPAKTRRQLITAYTGQAFEPQVTYPAITWAKAHNAEAATQGVISLTPAQPRTVTLTWLEPTPDALVAELRRSLQAGGCAAVICNTVKRAQEIFILLREAKLTPEDDLILFHARFPFNLRIRIEQMILDRFGKVGPRPQQAIVVATQVIEQSLDLDFDLLISDLAPIDLILQRLGRLHRHQHLCRPAPLKTPRLVIVQPLLEGEIPQFGADRLVYAPYILLRSYLALRSRTTLNIPTDVQPLIEAVYDDEISYDSLPPAWQQALAEAQAKLKAEVAKQEFVAQGNLILPPDHEDLLRQKSRCLDEDQPELHETLQALTRMIRPTVTLVCLHQTPNGLALDPRGEKLVDLVTPPDGETACALAECKVSPSDPRVVKFFAEQEPPPGWTAQPMLRSFRPAVFYHGKCSLGEKLHLIYDLNLGIVIEEAA